MKKRITIFHERPIKIAANSTNMYAIIWRKDDCTFKNIDYWTHEELLKCADTLRAFRPEPMVFASIFRGEWYYRRHITEKSNQRYGYLVQYLGGVFYFHSYHHANKFAELVLGFGPHNVDHPTKDPS